MQSDHPHSCPSVSTATKLCRKCGQWKTFPFFPRDRSRPDGRWHTCRACNRLHWHAWGKKVAEFRTRDRQAERKSHTGLEGLRKYPRKHNRKPFEPELEIVKEDLRVGDSAWARRMRRVKGYCRAERRKAIQEEQLAQIRAKTASNARVVYLSHA